MFHFYRRKYSLGIYLTTVAKIYMKKTNSKLLYCIMFPLEEATFRALGQVVQHGNFSAESLKV